MKLHVIEYATGYTLGEIVREISPTIHTALRAGDLLTETEIATMRELSNADPTREGADEFGEDTAIQFQAQ